MITSIAVGIGVVFVFILFGSWLNHLYNRKFDSLVETLKELIQERDQNIKAAFDERDERFKRLQSVLAQTIIRDTSLFDTIAEYNAEEPNEHTTENSE